mmetsp:Transcript_8613/g.32401  ORF Transcript_8613/g.32401 Transcript_8613/m.32401 type:complete len:211 (-) Transcript_8613:728-1360(-)
MKRSTTSQTPWTPWNSASSRFESNQNLASGAVASLRLPFSGLLLVCRADPASPTESPAGACSCQCSACPPPASAYGRSAAPHAPSRTRDAWKICSSSTPSRRTAPHTRPSCSGRGTPRRQGAFPSCGAYQTHRPTCRFPSGGSATDCQTDASRPRPLPRPRCRLPPPGVASSASTCTRVGLQVPEDFARPAHLRPARRRWTRRPGHCLDP